jgi:two-component system sensor kinase FixL
MTEVAKLVRSDAIRRNVHVASRFDPRLPQVACDPIQIQQVTLNLLMNAFDAISEVPTAERQVSMRLDGEGGDMAKVTIRDSGIGLSPGTLSQMFTPFYTTKTRGLGMGLAISQSIIEAHGGRIWAENNPVSGATFYFTLPLKAHRSSGAEFSAR